MNSGKAYVPQQGLSMVVGVQVGGPAVGAKVAMGVVQMLVRMPAGVMVLTWICVWMRVGMIGWLLDRLIVLDTLDCRPGDSKLKGHVWKSEDMLMNK